MEAVQALSEYELERGKPLLSVNHAFAQYHLITAFSHYAGKYSILPELSLELGGRPLTPDISICPKHHPDWLHDQVKKTEPPLLVVEILSPKQCLDDLIAKAETYLEGGVGSCWVVQPILQLVTILLPGEKPTTCTSGEVTDPGTGISVKIDEVFPAE